MDKASTNGATVTSMKVSLKQDLNREKADGRKDKWFLENPLLSISENIFRIKNTVRESLNGHQETSIKENFGMTKEKGMEK